jgi:hypothetical protein
MQSRNQQSASLCEFAERLEQVANVLYSRISEQMTPSHWEACQITLWSFYQELAAELKERGRFHYSSPAGPMHRCLAQAYEDAKAKLHVLEQTHLPPPPVPPRQRPPRSPDEVVNDISSLADAVKRPGDTFLGEERKDNATPGGNR